MSIEVDVVSDKKIEDIIYFVKAGDTVLSVAEKFCVKVEDLILDNDLSLGTTLEVGDILWIRRRNMAMHIVKPLDTFEGIAQKYNVSVEHIKSINNISSLFIGQKIII